MRQLVTPAIILTRTDYGEADRILTLLTPDQGKIRLLAKGVRRVKSKLAGGIELFSISTITYIKGRGEIGTLVSARLETHFGRIVQDIHRTMLGYELIKLVHRNTEDEPESAYFYLLEQAFTALNDSAIPPELIRLWVGAQLVRLAGHAPNLQTDASGNKLQPEKGYDFNFDSMCFAPHPDGRFTARHIKFLRLAFAGQPATVLSQVQGGADFVDACAPLVTTMLQTHLRV